MSISHKKIISYFDSNSTVLAQQTETFTGNNIVNYNEALASGTNVQRHLAFTQADLQSLMISTTTACTIYTNAASSGSPQDTIALTAGKTLVWSLASDLIGTCPFSGDVTSIYITNAGATTLQIVAVTNQ